jgi:hypothetical protein
MDGVEKQFLGPSENHQCNGPEVLRLPIEGSSWQNLARGMDSEAESEDVPSD